MYRNLLTMLGAYVGSEAKCILSIVNGIPINILSYSEKYNV